MRALLIGILVLAAACGGKGRRPAQQDAVAATPPAPSATAAAESPLPEEFTTQTFARGDGGVFLLVSDVSRKHPVLFVAEPGLAKWSRARLPDEVWSMGATTSAWYALSGHALFVSRDRGASWTDVELPAVPSRMPGSFPGPPMFYGLTNDASGELLVIAWDRLIAVDNEDRAREIGRYDAAAAGPFGALAHAYPLPGGDLLVTTSPFGASIWRKATGSVEAWDQGLPAPEPGMSGALDVAIRGDLVVAVAAMGDVYVRRPTDPAWRAVTFPDATAFNRVLVADPASAQWILLTHNDEVVRFELTGTTVNIISRTPSVAPPALVFSAAVAGKDVVLGYVRAASNAAARVDRADGGVETITLP